MKGLLCFVLSFALIAQAETVSIQSDVNARSSVNFVSDSNILAVISKGTEGKVLRRKQLLSGNYAIEIKVTKLGGDTQGNVELGDNIWVYYHTEPQRRFVELYDRNQKKTNDPSLARSAVANQTFQIENRWFPGVRNNSCTKAGANGFGVQSELKNQLSSLQKLTHTGIPTLDPTVEEIMTYIHVATDKDGYASNDDLAIHRQIAEMVKKYCEQYDVPIPLVLAMMRRESQFRPNAGSDKGAKGLMQLMAGTAKSLADGKKVDRTDVETNIRLAIIHLKNLLKKYHGNFRDVLIAYNAGEGRLRSYLKGLRGLPNETQKYIKVVLAYYSDYQSVIRNTALAFDQ